jgi:hypothetical protein
MLYVEGPRDRDVLSAWARRFSPPLARVLAPSLVILGGRRPGRAVEHFRLERARHAGVRGLCVLDRDGGELHVPFKEPGLEFFTWSRRHIESYLLVPAAIGRGLRLSPHDGRIVRFFRDRFPSPEDERAWCEIEAKSVFSPHGELARLLGQAVPPGKVARAMRAEELHPDVRALLGRLRAAFGISDVEATLRRG